MLDILFPGQRITLENDECVVRANPAQEAKGLKCSELAGAAINSV